MNTTSGQRPRLIVADLARGLALLGIATANATQAWMFDSNSAPGWSLGGIDTGSAIDSATAVFAALFVHVRGLPMFSTLLGFGFGIVAANLHSKNYPAAKARKVLARRYGFLALFGLVHALVFFYGDIMTTYGFLGVAMALMLTQKTKTLRIIAYSALALSATFMVLNAVVLYLLFDPSDLPWATPTEELATPALYLAENARAAQSALLNLPIALFSLGGLVLLGYVWAREGVLVDVDKHRRTLVTWTVIAAVAIAASGIPLALAALQIIDPAFELPFYVSNTGVGLLTGPGILAALALASAPLQRRINAGQPAPAWTYPFLALGKRSMSGYLMQSVLFILLCMPFTLGIGVTATITERTAVAVVVWLITLILASVLEAAGRQGPFEQLHRRLSYGPTKRLEPYVSAPHNKALT
ncbi:DUF418 domain-containing protein [Corynebacterium mayonis]|uniref:DUF418 domain-containing protein n=1 Tax=Corynebacterium mayonis TaxID=3062461 RepID=UPI00314038A9